MKVQYWNFETQESASMQMRLKYDLSVYQILYILAAI